MNNTMFHHGLNSLRGAAKRALRAIALPACLAGIAATSAHAEPKGMLETIHKHKFLTSTVAANGDLNPYAVVVAPVSVGAIE